MTNVVVKVDGVETLLQKFEQLPQKVQEDLFKNGLRRGLGIVQDRVKNNAPYKRGYVKKSVKLSIRKSGRNRPGPYGEVRVRSFYGKFLEFGTDPHFIRARYSDEQLRGAFTRGEIAVLKQAGAKALRFGDFFGARVRHPGIRGRGFMRRSWDEVQDKAIDEIKRSIRNSILYGRLGSNR